MSDTQLHKISGRGCVIRGDDIDTDRIIPARYLVSVTFEGLGEHVFEDDRKEMKGKHSLDNPHYQGSSILISEKNFGCGSSREHAPQALMRWGFRAFVGISFAEIFAGNCTINGLPCVRLTPSKLDALMKSVELDPSQELRINLDRKTIECQAGAIDIEIPEGVRQQFLRGTWSVTDLLLDARSQIKETAERLPYIKNFAD